MEVLAVVIGIAALWLFVVRGAIAETRKEAALWGDSSAARYAWEFSVELVSKCGVRLFAFVVYAAITVGLFAIGLGPLAVVLALVGWGAVAFARWMKRGYDEEMAKPLDIVTVNAHKPTDAPASLRLRDLRPLDDYELLRRKIGREYTVNVKDIGRYS